VFDAACRTIDMSAGGAKAALDTDTGFCDRGSKVDFRFLD
jgi:hypothetical protein